MLAQTESWPRCRRISLLLGLAGSAAADFPQAPLMGFYFSLMVMLLSVHAVVKRGIASLCPFFMGGFSPVLYRPAMLKLSKTLVASKILAPAWNSLIFTKLQQSTSLLTRRPIKKRKKHKCSLLQSNVSSHPHNLQIRVCLREPLLRPLTVEWDVGDREREGGLPTVPPALITIAAGEARCARWRGGNSLSRRHFIPETTSPVRFVIKNKNKADHSSS